MPPSTTSRARSFKALKEAAPKGIDVYFDNVGGDILEACLFQMNNGGRVACCGAISAYDGRRRRPARAACRASSSSSGSTLKGFIVTGFLRRAREGDCRPRVAGWRPASSRSRRT